MQCNNHGAPVFPWLVQPTPSARIATTAKHCRCVGLADSNAFLKQKQKKQVSLDT